MKLSVEYVLISWSDMEKFKKIPSTNKKFSLIAMFLLYSVRMSEYVPLCESSIVKGPPKAATECE